MKPLITIFFGFNAGYHQVLKWLLTLLLGFMIIPVFLQIVSRHVSFVPRYIWTEEVARFCFVWMIMIGSMIAVRESTHFEVNLFQNIKSPIIHLILRMCVLGWTAALALVFIIYGQSFARLGHAQTSEMTGINMLSIYIAFPLAGMTWMLFLLEQILREMGTYRSARQKENA